MRRMKYLRISIVAQLLLAIYFQLINWFRLGSWNFQPGFVPLFNSDKIDLSDLVLLIAFILPFLLFLFAYWRRWNWLMWIGTIGYCVWFFLQIKTWWVPYLFGASSHWQEVYNRVFAQSTKILPSFGNHLAPDAMHLTIQLLLLVIIVSSILGLLQDRRKRQSPS
jgi:hypothetical protein